MQRTIEIHAGAPRYPVLQEFMRSRARCNFLMGPLGSGKTFGEGLAAAQWSGFGNCPLQYTPTTITCPAVRPLKLAEDWL